MKDRLKKKIEKRERQKLHAMLDVVLNINGTEARQRKMTGELPTAFFEFNGQIGIARVSIHEHGWYEFSRPTEEVEYSSSHYYKCVGDSYPTAMRRLKQTERRVLKR